MDAELLKEYIGEISKDSALESLSAKMLRFLIFGVGGSALGTVLIGPPGVVAGLALNSVDTFVVDKVLRGWKPNAFVNELKSFASK